MPAMQSSPSTIYINLGALRKNVAALRKLIGTRCAIYAVVKSNAYGHGATEIAHTILSAGANAVCVANIGEAATLRHTGVDGPIILLNATRPNQAREVAVLHITPALYSQEMAEALAEAALRVGYGVTAHIKVDTGMGRVGLPTEEAVQLARSVSQQDSSLGGFSPLTITGIFSHLATAEEEDESYALGQFQRFQQCIAEVQDVLPEVRAHIANSAATLKFPMMRLNAVRCGLLLYGVYPSNDLTQEIVLTPVLSWKTFICFVKRIPAGAYVSYGRTWQATTPTTVVTLPVGYGDGYTRQLSNTGYVLFRGKRRPVVGTVCMNHILVDVGDEADVQTGEEVVLLGRQMGAEVSAADLAQWAGTVPHEILTRLNPNIERVYIK